MSDVGGERLVLLAEEHVEIRTALMACLDAVAEGEADEARARFGRFADRLIAHADAEEAHLIPLFVARGLETTGCTAAILQAEHAKLKRLLRESRQRLPRAGGALPPRARVEFVLGAHMLLEVLEHHDQRERAAFFPALDAALDERERAALYAICARSQASA